MKAKAQVRDQGDLFRSKLENLLDKKHPLFKLAKSMDWNFFEKEFGEFYSEGMGRPALPIRLLVGLHYLKSAYNLSDESVVDAFLENPYQQYFLGYEYFQHHFPLDPTSLVRWRQRIGSEGMEMLLHELLQMAQRLQMLKLSDMQRVTVDTTVQEKAVSFPTDSRLYQKGRELLVAKAEEEGLRLRQNYKRVGRKAAIMQGRYARAGQYNRAGREKRRLKTYLGRVVRDIERKLGADHDASWDELLEQCHRVLNQKRNDKDKLYSFHAPEVECIGKGKTHKKYEFGCKVSVVSTTRDNWVVGVQALHGNPYDGHSLEDAIRHAETMMDGVVKSVFVDRGYRGHDYAGKAEVHLAGKKVKSRALKRWMQRRNAVEPVIGHLKSDHRMDRNYLSGEEGDRINAILAACGFNIRKVLRAFFVMPFFILEKILRRLQNIAGYGVWHSGQLAMSA